MRILEVEGLNKYFGGLAAVSGVDFYIEQGEILGLIGPNGAGKTTTFNLICGLDTPTSGVIGFKGEDITGLRPHQICRKNIAKTFQSVKLFFHMTVLENVLVGSLFGASMGMSEARKAAEELLDFVGLSAKSGIPARGLTIYEQKRLEIARALATKPELLLLDEVMAGLTPTEVSSAVELIRKINDGGVTILMIEHVMHAIMGVSDRIIVLHYGRKLAEGTPQEISTNREVIEVYLGE